MMKLIMMRLREYSGEKALKDKALAFGQKLGHVVTKMYHLRPNSQPTTPLFISNFKIFLIFQLNQIIHQDYQENVQIQGLCKAQISNHQNQS